MDTEGERAGSSAAYRQSIETLTAALRAGYSGISALLGNDLSPSGITDAQRLEVFTSYGWSAGLIGRFTDDRVLVLAELARQGVTTIANPPWRYSSEIVALVDAQLLIIAAEEPEAVTGDREVAVSQRIAALDLLETRLSRVRYFYCSASDDLDKTHELARIGFQPRRPRGAGPTPEPPVTPPAP